MSLFKVGAQALVVLVCCSMTASLRAGTINPGTPTADGTDTFTITLLNGKVVTVPVDVTKGMPRADKAAAIQQAIVDAGVDASVLATGSVSVPQAKGISGKATSGETDTFALLLLPTDGSAFAQVDLHLRSTATALAGIDGDGNASTFTAGFEFVSPTLGDIALFASLGFADLITPTLAGVLQQEFDLLQAQLAAQAPSLLGGLSLDLAAGAIVFQPTGAFTSASVTSGTTDIGLVSTMSISLVPEPPTLAMTGIALAFGAGVFLRRRFIGATC